jgi:hypothetical protein
MGTPSETNAVSKVVQDGADGAGSAACVIPAGSAACVVVGRGACGGGSGWECLPVDPSDGGALIEEHSRHLELVEGAGKCGRGTWRRVEPTCQGRLHG